MTTDELPSAEQRAVQMLGGVARTPRVVNVKTRPDEIIKPAPTKDNRPAFNYLQPQEWVRRGLPEDSVAPSVATREYLERRQWATSIWIPESEEYDPEQNTLTLRGYYRVYLFDVWVKPGEHSDDEEATQP